GKVPDDEAPRRRAVLGTVKRLVPAGSECTPWLSPHAWRQVRARPNYSRHSCEEDLMKLTRASSYALHAVVYMSAQKHDHPIPSHLVAQERGIPERFLLKVLKPLVSARILHSVKGPNGGYRMAKAASDVTLLDVVEAVDGPIRGLSPFGKDENDG